jgi:ABC-type uncharacterized transport system permease subunit
VIVAGYFVIEIFAGTKTTGFFVLLLSFIIQAISSLLYNWNLTDNPLLNNPVYAVHVALTILGYSAICISGLYALLYCMLNNTIRHRRLGLIYDKLPSLTLLEQMSIRSVLIGVIFLGLGISLGHLCAGEVFGTYWPKDAKVIFTDIIWLGYFIGYIIAQLNKWRGRWMAYLSMAGFGILVLANITIVFIENTFHQFH